MDRIKIILFTLLIFLASGTFAQAQEPINATTNGSLLQEMPRRALFTLEANSSAGELTEARLFFQPVGSGARISEPITFDPASEVSLEHEWPMQKNSIPPGAKIEYFWRLTDSTGNTFETPKQSFVPLDPRFDWQTIEDEELAISWYDGDQAWGQEMFDTGKEALAQLEDRLAGDITQQVRMVAFANKSDFAGTFATTESWVGGQAFTDLGVTVQIIGNGKRNWMQTVLFHELSHLVLHQIMEGSIVPVPSWLNEGLAMYNEPVSRSVERIQNAAENGDLLRFSYLQGNFGSDGQQVSIAYAQSEMMVTYLIEDCGEDGFRQLFENMGNNMRVDKALEAACGYDDKSFHDQWRQSLPNPPTTQDAQPAAGTNNSEPESNPPSISTEQNSESDNVSSFILLLLVGGLCFIGLMLIAIVFVVMRLLRPQGGAA
ncbi:MAG: peptidase MA family metallohydrolase [Ardenticatenaceae bacterium]